MPKRKPSASLDEEAIDRVSPVRDTSPPPARRLSKRIRSTVVTESKHVPSGEDTLAKPKRTRKTKETAEKVTPPVDTKLSECQPNTTLTTEEATADASPPTKKRRVASKRKTATAMDDAGEDEPSSGLSDAPEPENESPKRTKKATRKKATDEDGNPIKKPRAARTSKKKEAAEPELDEDGNPVPPKPRKKRVMKPKPPVVYDIPDVERKETTFKGRLGYACLNTILRATKPDSIFCSRTCRIDTIEKNGMQVVYDLGLQNARDLYKMIEWNEANNIKFMRMSSEMFPFASHKKYGYRLDHADAELKAAGELARKLGHRLTMHPGQFTQLGSPRKEVIESSVRELEYQCEIMDRMGLDQDGVMIIHMGGTYGDKAAALERFKVNYTEKLSDSIKARLVLENDELCYNVDDIMPVADELNIPIVVDYHHDWINPSSRPLSELIPIVNETWARKGIRVKQHLSEPRPGAQTVMEKRAHADRCQSLPDALPDDIDLMIEAKDKEQAVFELHRIYGLAPVVHENLRPPTPPEKMTLATGGRKSNAAVKKRKAKEEEKIKAQDEKLKVEGLANEEAPESEGEALIEEEE